MKIRTFAILLVALLSVSLLAGCDLHALEARFDAVEDAAERRADAAEDAVENTIRDALTPDPVQPAQPSQPAENTAELTQELQSEDAEAIALEHAGLSADAVTGLRTQYEIDDGVSHYDVQFYKDHLEYEYEIHSRTGDILSFDMDD